MLATNPASSGTVPMLTVASVLIPDLRLDEHFRRYEAEIDTALRDLGSSPERSRQVVAVLVHSSYDLHDNRSYPSWEMAVRRIDLHWTDAGVPGG
jgi:hypothetical protein